MRKQLLKSRENIFMFTTLLLLCSIPLNFAYSTIAFLIFTLLNIASADSLKKPKLNKINIVLLVFYGTFFISLFCADSIDEGLTAIYKKSPLLLMPIVFLYVPQLDIKKIEKIWKGFAIFLTLLFIYFLITATFTWTRENDMDIFFYHSLVSPLKLNAIYVSYLVSASFLFLLGSSKKSTLQIITLIILIAFLLLLSSKLVIVFTFIFASIQIIMRKNINFKLFLIVVLLLSGIIYFSPVFSRFKTEMKADYTEVLSNSNFGNVYDWKGSTIRLLLLRVGVETLDKEKAWIGGVGIGNSQPFIESNLKEKGLYYDFWDYNFHNQFMQIFVEIGFIGLLIYLLLFVLLISDFKAYSRLLSIVLLMFSWGLTESFLWRQRGMLLFLIVIILLYQYKNAYIKLKDE